jgi:hypothetical protein
MISDFGVSAMFVCLPVGGRVDRSDRSHHVRAAAPCAELQRTSQCYGHAEPTRNAPTDSQMTGSDEQLASGLDEQLASALDVVFELVDQGIDALELPFGPKKISEPNGDRFAIEITVEVEQVRLE